MKNTCKNWTDYETPPRTWRRPRERYFVRVEDRNTSTDVEKTPNIIGGITGFEKHLHGRGEDQTHSTTTYQLSETPPRTWRRHHHEVRRVATCGNTSTDVEKTRLKLTEETTNKKHLHGRGEDQAKRNRTLPATETPPRTWRRLAVGTKKPQSRGNTSTDVEKTFMTEAAMGTIRKHLHGRGEDQNVCGQIVRSVETPPRTWRRPPVVLMVRWSVRNTSTDVEKTSKRAFMSISPEKHLHGRGED